MAYLGFKKLQGQIEAEGKSPQAAARITAAIGRNKYGKKGMARKAAIARKRASK